MINAKNCGFHECLGRGARRFLIDRFRSAENVADPKSDGICSIEVGYFRLGEDVIDCGRCPSDIASGAVFRSASETRQQVAINDRPCTCH
jgi:hypothetical protein